ncbi:MAG: hypothetical protein MR368_03595 [Azospirillum sp.]|nr:hypothetical protein [Azospirillum sp.]
MKFFVALMLACVLTLGMANAAEENVSQQEQNVKTSVTEEEKTSVSQEDYKKQTLDDEVYENQAIMPIKKK